MVRLFIEYFGICSIRDDIRRSPENLERTIMNCLLHDKVEVLIKVFIEIITEILKCIISSFVSKN